MFDALHLLQKKICTGYHFYLRRYLQGSLSQDLLNYLERKSKKIIQMSHG